MANVGNGTIFQANLQSYYQGSNVMNVLHYRLEVTGGATADHNILIGDIITVFQAAATGVLRLLRDCQSENVEHSYVQWQVISPVRYAPIRSTFNNGIGLIAEPGLPSNSAATIQKSNENSGRTNRGSIHVAGIPVSGQEEGRLTAGQKALLGLFAEAASTPIAVTPTILVGNFVPIILHKASPATSGKFTRYALGQQCRTQYRRTSGVGE